MVSETVNDFWPGDFWQDRRVLVTGHTGFKGAWLCAVLNHLGARVTGLALEPEAGDSLYDLIAPLKAADSHIGDIRDRDTVRRAVSAAAPDIVLHLAAQSLVRRSYDAPFDTFDVNILGSLTLLDVVADTAPEAAILVVTSDKVYRNDDQGQRFREGDPLGGHDPYSASKAACEIAVRAFADARRLNLATARAGNVIGGGDFSADRLLPDAWRAFAAHQPLVLRHPEATRPWQHVLDVVFAYLAYAQALYEAPDTTPKSVNIGPDDDALMVGEAVAVFLAALGRDVPSSLAPDAARPEKTRLELDTALGRTQLGLYNRLSQREAIGWAAAWYLGWSQDQAPKTLTTAQIEDYVNRHGQS